MAKAEIKSLPLHTGLRTQGFLVAMTKVVNMIATI
jgi:hypothetical protein